MRNHERRFTVNGNLEMKLLPDISSPMSAFKTFLYDFLYIEKTALSFKLEILR